MQKCEMNKKIKELYAMGYGDRPKKRKQNKIVIERKIGF